MRKLIRSPLTWAVAGEVVVVSALLVVAWNVVAGAARPAAVLSPALDIPEVTADDPLDLPGFPIASQPGPDGPLPGLNRNPGFWRARLAELNRDQAAVARLEWQLVHGATDAIKRYLETVVLPAMRRAEHAGSRR